MSLKNTVYKKYEDKGTYIAFIDEGKCSVFNQDEALDMLPENITNSVSWENNGRYTWNKTPNKNKEIITILQILKIVLFEKQK